MMSYWTQFAASGDPNRSDLPAWPRFDKSHDVHLTLAPTPKSGTGLHRKGGALFDRFES
jgi:carboxylesterase type B